MHFSFYGSSQTFSQRSFVVFKKHTQLINSSQNIVLHCSVFFLVLSSALLSDNPWRCDCALHWLRSWIDEEGQRLLSSAERRLVCTEPPRLSHLSLVEVPLNSLVCIPPLVQLEPRRLAVRLGESLRVSCHASGYPRPQVGLLKVLCYNSFSTQLLNSPQKEMF